MLKFRYAKAPEGTRIDGEEAECRWCGFQATVGMHRYVEDDGENACACSICFAARHGASIDRGQYALAWVEELSQEDVSHLCRVVGLVHARIVKNDSRTIEYDAKIEQRIRTAATDVFAWFLTRNKELEKLLESHLGCGTAEVWDSLEPKHAELLAKGMRVFPLWFDEDELQTWANDDSSLNGYGQSMLFENGWFAEESGLIPPSVPARFRTKDAKEGK